MKASDKVKASLIIRDKVLNVNDDIVHNGTTPTLGNLKSNFDWGKGHPQARSYLQRQS